MKHRLLLFALVAILSVWSSACRETPSQAPTTPEESLKMLDAKLYKHPKDAALLFERAQIYMQMNRVNEAISDLTRAISIDNSKIGYHLLLADAHFANGDVEHAYSALRAALELNPENEEATLKMGEIAYYSRDYDRAMECLTSVTAKDPNNRTALFMKAFIYKETGDTTNAVLLLRKVCDLYPDYDAAFEELGILYASRLDPLALEYLSTAIRINPQNTSALYALAMYQQDSKQYDKAEELYKQILDINPNHKDAWHNRGYIQLFVYGDTEQAIEYLTRALQCDPAFIEALVNRGCAYELEGNREKALADYHAALDLDHTFQPAIDGVNRLK